jgi:hypothetical protein
MTDFQTEHCLIFLSDADFNVLTEKPINGNLKVELLKMALPQGSKWKAFAGARSISFFPLKALPQMFALSYSVATQSIETPILSFIIILNRQQSEQIIKHRLQGIENAFIRRFDIFASLDKHYAEFLKSNIVSFKASEPVNASNSKGKTENNQVLFFAPYYNQRQWQTVESSVLEKSASSLLSFRTLALQKEISFQVVGLVVPKDSNKSQKKKDNNAVIIIAILFVLLIVAVIIVLLILAYAQQESRQGNASQQSVHLTLGILRHFWALSTL